MVRVSTITLFILFIVSAGYEIAIFAVPTMMLEGDYQAITGKSYEEILPPEAIRVSVFHTRHMMVIGIAHKVAAFFILFAGFRKAERWAWWAMLAVGGIAYTYGAVVNVLNGNMQDSVLLLVALVVFVVALLLPVKKFLARSS
ncbi:MAG: hypothetical protein JSV89_13600 [Spirochaetaceae bacterium]|nr:MAG: hypothetical protein JSV89_13600 [Spirochaetaceae bacterium]